jgi:hypothetical protein
MNSSKQQNGRAERLRSDVATFAFTCARLGRPLDEVLRQLATLAHITEDLLDVAEAAYNEANV